MKIAIVCGHYIPDFGYIEVHLAKAFKKMGHEVVVVTSTEVPAYVRNIANVNYNSGKSSVDEIDIVRLAFTFSFGQMVKCKGVVEAIKSENPDKIICIGVGKLFCNPVYANLGEQYPIITLLGNTVDNYWLVAKTTKQKLLLPAQRLKLFLSHQWFKNKAYKLAVQHSKKLCSYTPEAVKIVKKYIPQHLHQQLVNNNQSISLGFDTSYFFFDENERKEKRKELNIEENETVIITATRVTRHKKLEDIIELVSTINSLKKPLKYVIVGFLEDEYGKELKEFVASQNNPNLFHLLPFLEHDVLRKYYAASDIGLWIRPTISTLEAMGCGLPIVIENREKVSHLLTIETGWYYEKNEMLDTLQIAINNVSILNEGEKVIQHKTIRKLNEQKFSYQTIGKQILGTIVV